MSRQLDAGESRGLLVFQLINGDGDTGSVIQISQVENEVDPAGMASPTFPSSVTSVAPGPEVDLGGLTPSEEFDVVVSQVQLDTQTGQYIALVQVENTGDPVGTQVVVVFENLPEGVTVLNPSGVDAAGNPYLNLKPGIDSGGLDTGERSEPIQLEIDNPQLRPFELQAQVLTGGANQAPLFEPITLPNVMPGEVFTLPLEAVDPDGDGVTYSLRSDGPLPTGQLRGDGTLDLYTDPGPTRQLHLYVGG